MKNVKLIIVLLVAIFLVNCKGKDNKDAEVNNETAITNDASKTKLSKDFTDDDFIEYWAQLSYITNKYAENPNPTKWAEDMRKVYEKLGISEEEKDAFQEKYQEWLDSWSSKAASDPNKFGKEWEALMNKYNKRVEELMAGK